MGPDLHASGDVGLIPAIIFLIIFSWGNSLRKREGSNNRINTVYNQDYMEIKIEESKYILCLFKINWHKSGTFLRLLKKQFSVDRWYSWRTSRDSNPEPTD